MFSLPRKVFDFIYHSIRLIVKPLLDYIAKAEKRERDQVITRKPEPTVIMETTSVGNKTKRQLGDSFLIPGNDEQAL